VSTTRRRLQRMADDVGTMLTVDGTSGEVRVGG
jgi:hypothetical protein